MPSFIASLRTSTLTVLALTALILNLLATRWLDASYAASQFPVPYHVGQLSFDAQKVKGWYAHMIERGTLGIYWQTQFIDFAFIATTLVLHVSVLLLISRLFEAGSTGRKVMVAAAALSAIAPIADALENLVSFVMLSDPKGFPPTLAIAHSSFATIKFAFFVFAYVAAAIGALAGLVAVLRRRARS